MTTNHKRMFSRLGVSGSFPERCDIITESEKKSTSFSGEWMWDEGKGGRRVHGKAVVYVKDDIRKRERQILMALE